MRRTLKSVLFLILFMVSSCSLDDSLLKECSLEGIVKNTAGETLSNVSVELVTANGSLFTSTDQSGYYSFRDVPYGIVILKFNYEEYYTNEKKLTLNDDVAIKTVDITLRRFPDDYYLNFSPQSFSLKNIDTKAELSVYTNAEFQVSTNAYWITLTPTEALGNSKISISCTPNNEPVLREAEIIISGQYGIEERIMITQQPGPILSTEGIDNPGYLPNVNKEGILIHFSRPVEFISVYEKNNSSSLTVEHELVNEGRTVKLRGFRQPIFDQTTYTLKVKSTDGIIIETDFELHCYIKKMDYFYSNILFMPGNELFWAIGEEHSLHHINDMKPFQKLPDKHTYFYIGYTEDKIICFRKKYNGDFFIDFYEGNTGKYITEKKMILDTNYSVSAASLLNNGKALLRCDSDLFLLDTNQAQPQPVKISTDGIDPPDFWNKIPNKITAAGQGNSFYLYHSEGYNHTSNIIYRVDANTGDTKKIEFPSGNWIHGRSLSSSHLIFSFSNKILIVNTDTSEEIEIPTSEKHGQIKPIEKEGQITHIFVSSGYNTLSIIDVHTKRIYPIYSDSNPELCSNSYTGKYQLIRKNGYQSAFYIFETDLLISSAIQP